MTSTAKNQRPCTGQTGARKAEIRQAVDGFSLFTWSDYGGKIGVIQWRERHGLDWQTAYAQFVEWLNGAPV